MSVEALLLGLILLELERANELGELAAGAPVQQPARLRLTDEEIIDAIKAWLNG